MVVQLRRTFQLRGLGQRVKGHLSAYCDAVTRTGHRTPSFPTARAKGGVVPGVTP